MESMDSTEMHQATQGTDPSQNPISPYYLHPGENPGFILVSPPMDGSNYSSWFRSTKRALMSKNKFRFVNGTITMPEQNDPSFDAWERCNSMVIFWITRSLSQHISQSIVYIDSAQELWEDHKERFSKGDHFRTSDLLQEIHSIRQGDKDISAYFTDIKIIWEELESLRTHPMCTCNVKCKCNFLRAFRGLRETEYVYAS
ncbi:PREDICTED: uncharacterized protein LOC109329284 [Lupinus angustifolius]|uniref:uncharacterized protein LOC109329284 n=1 Tax=Lupinus angustifolius TaxID=3871 RepID=UPI00092F28F5|nr:PREDICTED: uncharacterized protein LOC109329284 [Lupinus angustifolius]